jgi:glucose-6-phosphate isomerase
MFEGADVAQEAAATFDRMRAFCDGVRGGTLTGYSGRPFTDVVNIGIGGSDLGPALVTEALAPYAAQNLDTHFVSNVDGAQLAGVLERLNAETTLFIVASKTFTTLETLANARTAREWLFSKSGAARPLRYTSRRLPRTCRRRGNSA